jgi:hypothetical protein
VTADQELPLVKELEKPKRRWRLLLLEIAAIFIGITASFWVDEWREQEQDTETFHRILGEIYYDITLDESVMTGWAATNNLQLDIASDLVLRDTDLPSADELFRQLDYVFFGFEASLTLGGYSRLTNTALNIPVNDIQLTLDNLYGVLVSGHEAYLRQAAQISELATAYWSANGVIPCLSVLEGIQLSPAQSEDLDMDGQVLPADRAIRQGDECLPEPFNHAVAIRVMEDDEFRTALRRVIAIRRYMASQLAWQRGVTSRIRSYLEDYMPAISLPVETLGILGSATPAQWNEPDAIAMQRLGPNDWELDIELMEGEVKFVANNEWTMNWGARRPWIATGSAMGFEEGQLSLEEAFPSGTAWFNGLNIPVRSGRYRVRFNTQSREYSFESLED